MSTEKKYGPNIVDLNARREELEKFYKEQKQTEGIGDITYLEFVSKAFENLMKSVDKIEDAIIKLKELEKSVDVEKLKESLSEFIEYFKDIFTTFQALIEISKISIPYQINEQIMVTIQQKLHEAQKEGSWKIEEIFSPLLDVGTEKIIEEKLKKGKIFQELLKEVTTNYSTINKKVTFLSDLIKDVENKEVRTKEELIDQIELLKKEIKNYSDSLYGELSSKIREIEKETELEVDEAQKKYDEIIQLIESEKHRISDPETVQALEPIIREVIEIELAKKGKFREILNETIAQLSLGKTSEEQTQYRQIVDNLVGKGTQKNAKIARENTQLGLKQMSESDIDEVIGGSIIKIVNNKSGIAENLGNLGRLISNNIGENKDAKQFFDGLSVSVYFYMLLKGDIKIDPGLDFLPKHLLEFGENVIDKIKEIVKNDEEQINKHPDRFKFYRKVMKHTISISDGYQEDIYCYMRFYEGMRLYFFLNQEPSRFFITQLDELLKSEINIDNISNDLRDIVKKYTLPNVELAVFNNDSFEIPCGSDLSVVSTKDGDKYLNFKQEDELIEILEEIKKKSEKYNTKRSFFQSPFNNKIKFAYGSKDKWYYWFESFNNQKYLAVKMNDTIQDENKENFFKYVNENIWEKLLKSKTESQRQKYVDSFMQKDSGIGDGASILAFIQKPLVKIVLWFMKAVVIIGLIVAVWFLYKSDGKIEKQINVLQISYEESIKLKNKMITSLTGQNDALSLENKAKTETIKKLIHKKTFLFPKDEENLPSEVEEDLLFLINNLKAQYRDDWSVIIEPYGNQIMRKNLNRMNKAFIFIEEKFPYDWRRFEKSDKPLDEQGSGFQIRCVINK